METLTEERSEALVNDLIAVIWPLLDQNVAKSEIQCAITNVLDSWEPKDTDVIFRFDRKAKEVIAIFPAVPGTNEYDVTIYVHNGQHGSAMPGYLSDHPLATEEQYAPLKLELERIGYQLNVVKRMTAKHSQARKEEVARVRSSAAPLKSS